MISDPITARAAFNELLEMLRINTRLETDDDLMIRLADIDITLQSIEAVAEITIPASARWNGVVLKSIEIGTDITRLAVDLLSWYALPAERSGSNEPPVGTVYAQRLRSRYLEQLAVDEAFMMKLRDKLAAFVLTQTTGPT